MKAKQALISLGFGFLGALCFSLVRENILPAARASRNQILTATGFNLVDGKGRLRAQIGFSGEGSPGIWILDEKGTARWLGGVYGDNTPYFGLQDQGGNMIELMRTFGPKQTPLLIFKTGGQDMMITGLNPTADPVPFLMSYETGRKKKVHFGKYDGP